MPYRRVNIGPHAPRIHGTRADRGLRKRRLVVLLPRCGDKAPSLVNPFREPVVLFEVTQLVARIKDCSKKTNIRLSVCVDSVECIPIAIR